MNKKVHLFLIIIINLCYANSLPATENFFIDAKKKFDASNFEDSKFLFQRNIVFNPKDAKSYLYLAKIYNSEENQKEEVKNLNTTLLLEPNNEEAIYMLINIELKKSNYTNVKKLITDFSVVCSSLCENIKVINEKLKNIEPKNDS